MKYSQNQHKINKTFERTRKNEIQLSQQKNSIPSLNLKDSSLKTISTLYDSDWQTLSVTRDWVKNKLDLTRNTAIIDQVIDLDTVIIPYYLLPYIKITILLDKTYKNIQFHSVLNFYYQSDKDNQYTDFSEEKITIYKIEDNHYKFNIYKKVLFSAQGNQKIEGKYYGIYEEIKYKILITFSNPMIYNEFKQYKV